jgi:hypothetical protein
VVAVAGRKVVGKEAATYITLGHVEASAVRDICSFCTEMQPPFHNSPTSKLFQRQSLVAVEIKLSAKRSISRIHSRLVKTGLK